MLVRGAHGNESVEVPKSRKSARKLSEEQIKRLFEICLHIEDHYRFPCDIEWAMTDDKIYILQSRPITTI
jgi:pyruvate,water dikinase